MEDPVLPIPVSPPDLREVAPRLCSEGKEPKFFCLWLAEGSKRAYATDGKGEVEVDYRRHRRWSREAIGEFAEEYTERMPGMMDPSESESIDGLMHRICLNLCDERSRRSWSYLFNREEGRSYVCVKRYARGFCRDINRKDRDDDTIGDAGVVGRIRRMRREDRCGSGAL